MKATILVILSAITSINGYSQALILGARSGATLWFVSQNNEGKYFRLADDGDRISWNYEVFARYGLKSVPLSIEVAYSQLERTMESIETTITYGASNKYNRIYLAESRTHKRVNIRIEHCLHQIARQQPKKVKLTNYLGVNLSIGNMHSDIFRLSTTSGNDQGSYQMERFRENLPSVNLGASHSMFYSITNRINLASNTTLNTNLHTSQLVYDRWGSNIS